MSPRPRKVSDDDVYQAAQRVMSRLGPAELTLAEIAREAGVTAGLLVQRYGSKRDLMLALADRFAGGSAEMFAGLRDGRRSPLGALRAYCACMAGMASSPEAVTRNFAYYQNDLADPDLRKHLATSARGSNAQLQKLIREAIAAGELRPATNPRKLARLIEAVVGGSMLSWAASQEGLAAKWMRRDFEALLEPYLA
jgi:AcrR family transcriptional regulator